MEFTVSVSIGGRVSFVSSRPFPRSSLFDHLFHFRPFNDIGRSGRAIDCKTAVDRARDGEIGASNGYLSNFPYAVDESKNIVHNIKTDCLEIQIFRRTTYFNDFTIEICMRRGLNWIFSR
jgi:hypothetical protein